MPDLWLIRHGETAWTLPGKHTGKTDIPLTPRGITQAEQLGRRLAGKPFARVLTSPLSRPRETCRLTGLLGQAQIDETLREWDYGFAEGRTTAEIQKEMPGWNIWTGAVPEGET